MPDAITRVNPFGGQVQSSAQVQESVIGLSEAEVAARALALRNSGLLPAGLTGMIDDSGRVVYRDPNTGDVQYVRADFFADFRPYVASVSVPTAPPSDHGTTYQPPGPVSAAPPARGNVTLPTDVGAAPPLRPLILPFGAEFVPIITGEPISTGVLTVIAAIGALFGGLFSGGVSAAVKRALEGLRAALTETADKLMRFAWTLANTVGRALQAFVKVWVRIIRPMLDALGKVIREVMRIYEKYARPVLRAIRRIRQEILYWYERVVRPILQAIQVIRTAIYIFRVAGFKWAEEVDAKLVRLQAAIMRPLWYALEKLNLVSAWINVMMSVDGVLRGNVLFNSIDLVAGRLARLLAWGGYVQVGAARAHQLTRDRADWGVSQAAAAVAEHSATNGGRLAPYAAAAEARLRSLMGG